MTNQINNQSIIPSTDEIQLTLTLKMTTAQVVETSVTVNNNSPIKDYVHPDDQTQPKLKLVPKKVIKLDVNNLRLADITHSFLISHLRHSRKKLRFTLTLEL